LKQAFDVSEVSRNESITNDYQAVYQNEQIITGAKVYYWTIARINSHKKQETFLFWQSSEEQNAFQPRKSLPEPNKIPVALWHQSNNSPLYQRLMRFPLPDVRI